MTKDAGLKKFEEVGNKLKAEVQHERVSLAQKAVLNAKISPEALEYLNSHSASVSGDLNTGVSTPQLRIHSSGVSTKNELADGSEPDDGQIFYTGTQEAWDSVQVILLTIRKVRLEQTNEVTGEKNMQATYLVAGLLNDSMKPFIMYVKGMSYNKVWALEEELKPYVTKRFGGIPLNMLKIAVQSSKEKVTQGKYKGQSKNVFQFHLVMDDANLFPILEGDIERLQLLDQATFEAEDMLELLISQRGMTEKEFQANIAPEKPVVSQEKEHVVEGEVEPIPEFPEDVDVSDDIVIPF